MTYYRLPLTLCDEITLLFTQVVGYIFFYVVVLCSWYLTEQLAL
jgi:hypothetical protein